MKNDYKSFVLWKRAFSAQRRDEHAEARQRLEGAFDRMREKVDALIKTIPADCKDLTIHDVTHLDALWEMASLIAGPEWELNPAETFVLGGAILLHDAGMSASAFPGGLDQLKQTEVWKDFSASALRQAGIVATTDLIASPPESLMPRIKFDVLRSLHAVQAEQMASQFWQMPDGTQLHLIDDDELRQAFGSSIGRIAHSHHWSIERVADSLSDSIGAGTILPAEWAVNEKKVACLLRCADAAHIDRRRAPSILYAAMRPKGLSAKHWGAQNKINKPSVDGSALIYTAGQPFVAEEAEDWWVAYDLIKIVDGEIRSTNSLLEEMGQNPFLVKRVKGAENARALSVYLRPDGWKPVDAEVRVSDPVHLAKTLGGSKLYGKDPLAPVRELLQNAADAVRARRALEERDEGWGRIRITIEPAETSGSCWLHIDDDGIGMTERIMSGPLLDFGKSIWNTSLLREEFPGLQARSLSPTGRFGIGFFSVFEIAHRVKVTSKSYRAGLSEAKTLEFRALGARPLMRAANNRELPRDFSTRVSLLVDNAERVTGIYRAAKTYPLSESREVSFASAVLKLVSGVDINIELVDQITPANFVHTPNIRTKTASEFLEELLPEVPERKLNKLITVHGDQMDSIVGPCGKYYGRAALYMLEDPEQTREPESGQVGVGGFVYASGVGLPVPYVGLIDGITDEAARRSARGDVPAQVIQEWATAQGRSAKISKLLPTQQMALAERILRLGGDPGQLPFCFVQGGLVDYHSYVGILGATQSISIALVHQYAGGFKTLQYRDLNSRFFTIPMKKDVVIIRTSPERLVSELLAKEIQKQGGVRISRDQLNVSHSLLLAYSSAEKVWGAINGIEIESAPIFDTDAYSPPSQSWVLTLRRGT